MPRPLLDPPCHSWAEDLTLPDEQPIKIKSLGASTPNHIDQTYLEIPRKTIELRNIFFLMMIPVIIASITALPILAYNIVIDEPDLLPLIAFTLVNHTICISYSLKTCLLPPRDEPIRFNRARKKIYAYNYTYCWWNPFEKSRTTTVAYEWSQVRAERWLWRGAHFKCGVVLSIIRSGTNEVIDRFQLTTMGADVHAWAYICAYMQEGPSALPPPGEPKDHNDVLWCELASRLAPKVVWPPEMDLESRTAASQDLSRV
ncbi:DUF6708 domain-containing protein [Pseudomonas sp. NPDC090233]|uniref:DUF6708 domain-containing protein n=1 Tax=Pseudomonas sp. NPDC090233 TaxID=3364479 RepID=UPI00383B227E